MTVLMIDEDFDMITTDADFFVSNQVLAIINNPEGYPNITNAIQKILQEYKASILEAAAEQEVVTIT